MILVEILTYVIAAVLITAGVTFVACCIAAMVTIICAIFTEGFR